jgi:hypothetical protein
MCEPDCQSLLFGLYIANSTLTSARAQLRASRSDCAGVPLAAQSSVAAQLDGHLGSRRRTHQGGRSRTFGGLSRQDSRPDAGQVDKARKSPSHLEPRPLVALRALIKRSGADTVLNVPVQNGMYGLHICGEGGEYETLTLDCPLFYDRVQL